MGTFGHLAEYLLSFVFTVLYNYFDINSYFDKNYFHIISGLIKAVKKYKVFTFTVFALLSAFLSHTRLSHTHTSTHLYTVHVFPEPLKSTLQTRCPFSNKDGMSRCSLKTRNSLTSPQDSKQNQEINADTVLVHTNLTHTFPNNIL